ncbi:MAG: transglutaminase domain-containing protein [Flavobacteriales bacterium]|nr:transglutaminase domain-containing protein [Flavobacteriales bacterium]
MKTPIIAMVSLMLSSMAFAQETTYKNDPVINAETDYSEYRSGEDWYKGSWRIAPEVEHDTLPVICYSKEESFEFRTDIDKIEFNISPNTSKGFYIKMKDGRYAHTVIKGIPFMSSQIAFNNDRNSRYVIQYQSDKSEYLERLKNEFPLDFLTSDMTDAETVLAIMNWTHNRWDHDGNNSPSKMDAITILTEASEGQQFPCFAYAIVLRDQLTALGYPSRTVYLKTADAETRPSSPGHVATEVYLDDIQKWVFLDAQFDVMPTLNDVPLNAVELQNAIGNHYEEFQLESLASEKTTKSRYVSFVYDYLYYFDTSLDNRYGEAEFQVIDGMYNLMLVPSGAQNLTHIGLWDSPVDYCLYTHSVSDFYAKPE